MTSVVIAADIEMVKSEIDLATAILADLRTENASQEFKTNVFRLAMKTLENASFTLLKVSTKLSKAVNDEVNNDEL